MHYSDYTPGPDIQDLVSDELLEALVEALVEGETLHQRLINLEILGCGIAGIAAYKGDLIIELVLLDIKRELSAEDCLKIDQAIRQFAEAVELLTEKIEVAPQ